MCPLFNPERFLRKISITLLAIQHFKDIYVQNIKKKLTKRVNLNEVKDWFFPTES